MELHVLDLWVPILLSGVAIFFASFLSWMVLQLHKQDWQRLKREDEFLAGVRGINPPIGSFMFPSCDNQKDMQSEEFQKKWKEGPRGIVTFFPEHNMGKNLVLTMLLFIAVNFTLAYLATIGFNRGEKPMTIFRFFATASLLVYLTGILQHAIWFKGRVVGHVVESLAYALIAGAIFAALWPAAETNRTQSSTPVSNVVAEDVSPPANYALDGYCSVSLMQEKRWVRGDVQFGATHRGQTYLFASASEQEEFLADPDHYAPVLGGHDLVRFTDAAGELVPGTREHGIMYNRQIYLFDSEESLQQFAKSRDRYLLAMAHADAVMAEMDKLAAAKQ